MSVPPHIPNSPVLPSSGLEQSGRPVSPSYSDRTAPGDVENTDGTVAPDTGDEEWTDAQDNMDADDQSIGGGHDIEVIEEEPNHSQSEPDVDKIVSTPEKDIASPIVDSSIDDSPLTAVSNSVTGVMHTTSTPPLDSVTVTPSTSLPSTAPRETQSLDTHTSTATDVPASATTLNAHSLDRSNSSRRSAIDHRSNRFSGFLSSWIHRRPDRDLTTASSPNTPSRTDRDASPTPDPLISRPPSPMPSRPVTPPPSLPPPTLRELGLSLTAVTSNLAPPHFNTPPASGTFLAPHYLLLCHAHGLDVLPLVSPPAQQPYALVRRVSFKSVVVMEERGVLVAIAGRRDGVRVYALAEVKKAVEWRVEVEIRRERDRRRREDAKRGTIGGVDKVFGELREPDERMNPSKTSLSSSVTAPTHVTPKPKRKKSANVNVNDVSPQNHPHPRPPTTKKVKTPVRETPPPSQDISDPPPAYTSSSPTRPRLKSQPSAISISQARSRSGSLSNVLSGTTARRRSVITQREGDEKGDWMDDHGSSEDEAINLATAGPSGSAALDERTSSMPVASAASPTPGFGASVDATQGVATLEVPSVPDGPRRVQTSAVVPSLNRRNRPAHLDLTRATTTTTIAVMGAPPPSPTPTLFTLRQALAVLPPAPGEHGGRSETPDMDGEEDDEAMPMAEPISFAQALMESRLPGLPPPGTRQPQQPILIGASHPIATGDEEPSSPRESASEAHSVAPSRSSQQTINRRRRRWSVIDGFFSQPPAAESSQRLTRPSTPDIMEEPTPPPVRTERTPTRLLTRSQSNRSRSLVQTQTPSIRSAPMESPPNTTPAQCLPTSSSSHHRFLPRIITQAFNSRRSDEASSPSVRYAGNLSKRPSGSNLAPQAPAPKLEYVKLPGTKGAIMIKAVETNKKSFLAILCGDAGEKVELFAGTYRTTLGLSRTFILPDSPRSLELQLQGDDLVEVFLVFSQNVFGLEPATVRVREVRVGRSERRAARRRNREVRLEEQATEADAPTLGDDDNTVSVSVSVSVSVGVETPQTAEPIATTDSSVARPGMVSRQTSQSNNIAESTSSGNVVGTAEDAAAVATSHMGAYTTFQQLSFSPQFPLAVIADECVIPPTYPSFLQYRAEHEADPNGTNVIDLANAQFSPPGLPVPLTLPPSKWFYRDPKGVVQGPWKASLMQSWYKDGLLPPDLPVRREEDTGYVLLKDLRLQSVDPTHPFRPPPPPLNSPVYPHISDPIKPLLSPISLLLQPKHYGPPALFFSTRSGHSTAIVDARGRSVLKGRFMWTSDDDEDFTFPVGRLGDVKRLEAFDVKGRAVLVAVRQGGMEVVDVGDALLKPADESRTTLPSFNPPISNTGRRGPFVWRIGTPLHPSPAGHIVSLLPKTPNTPSRRSTLGIGRSPGRPEFVVSGHEDAENRMQDELLFLGRRDENVYFCEKNTGSFRILRLCPDPTCY